MNKFFGLFLGFVGGCAAVQGYHGRTAVDEYGARVEDVPVPPRELPDVLARITEDRAGQAAANEAHLRSRRFWDSGAQSVAYQQMKQCEADHETLRAYCVAHLGDDVRCVPLLQMGPICMNQVGAGSRGGFGFGYGGFGNAGLVLQIGSPYQRTNWRSQPVRENPNAGDRDEDLPAYEGPAEEEGGQ